MAGLTNDQAQKAISTTIQNLYNDGMKVSSALGHSRVFIYDKTGQFDLKQPLVTSSVIYYANSEGDAAVLDRGIQQASPTDEQFVSYLSTADHTYTQSADGVSVKSKPV
ncbi:hypothetical protein OV760_26445 [Salmonella enterica subsp. enterica serovar 1,4,[5],12:i:-]|nr:hypothetical protein [Salmonella enterica subsp. enterica serovar 1,4,[5],12:i:-]